LENNKKLLTFNLVMIAHVSKESKHRDETKNTLIYAERASRITTRLQNSYYLEEEREFPMTHYQNLVTELREEVGRLKTKMLSERPRSAAVQQNIEDPETQQKKQELKYLREQIVVTFKHQMKLRRRLLEAESHLLGLELDAERQHMVISHWQGRKGKLYDKEHEPIIDVKKDSDFDERRNEVDEEESGDEAVSKNIELRSQIQLIL
jgi:kinesin family member 18/19